tara:strand:- start:101 stop:382 length:282 start_codon:yes stop_codon:yes gene_type:complete
MTKEKGKNKSNSDLLHKKHIKAEKKRKKALMDSIKKNRKKKPLDVVMPIYIKYDEIKELSKNLVKEYKSILDKKKFLYNNTISVDQFLKRREN